jgi:hypothetical protein
MNAILGRTSLITVLACATLGLGACGGTEATVPGATGSTGPSPSSGPASSGPSATSGPASSSASGTGASGERCATQKRWGTRTQSNGLAMTASPLVRTRAGRHACYDRVVFDIGGTQDVSYHVRYVPVVASDGAGEPVPVPGRAALEVIVRAPIVGTEEGTEAPPASIPRIGDDLVGTASLSGWESLRAVRFAGSFEGQSTIAVGVDGKRPFRVWIQERDSSRHVVLDIAH